MRWNRILREQEVADLAWERPRTMRETMYYNLIGEKICEYMRELSGEDLTVALHDEAVAALEEIWSILEDEALDDEGCIDGILSVFRRDYHKLSLRHKKAGGE